MTTGPVEVFVDSTELARLRAELLALSRELTPVESGLAYPAATLGGVEAQDAIDGFRTDWREARGRLAHDLERAAAFVQLAVEQYEHTEGLLRAAAENASR